MLQVFVKDVVGPSLDGSCYIVVGAGSKIFSIQCNYADADTCYNLVRGNLMTPNAYEFMNDVFSALNVQLDRAELEAVNGAIYGKLYYRTDKIKKPMRLACSNAGAVINAAIAAKASLEIDEVLVDRISDETIEYHRMKAAFVHLWPLFAPDSTELLEVLSEYIDKIQYRLEV